MFTLRLSEQETEIIKEALLCYASHSTKELSEKCKTLRDCMVQFEAFSKLNEENNNEY